MSKGYVSSSEEELESREIVHVMRKIDGEWVEVECRPGKLWKPEMSSEPGKETK